MQSVFSLFSEEVQPFPSLLHNERCFTRTYGIVNPQTCGFCISVCKWIKLPLPLLQIWCIQLRSIGCSPIHTFLALAPTEHHAMEFWVDIHRFVLLYLFQLRPPTTPECWIHRNMGCCLILSQAIHYSCSVFFTLVNTLVGYTVFFYTGSPEFQAKIFLYTTWRCQRLNGMPTAWRACTLQLS